MNETLYNWTFNFHKVVRQQNSGTVADFILPYSAVYLRIRKWKNYWNRSTFAKVILKIKVARFLWPTVYTGPFPLLIRPSVVFQIIERIVPDDHLFTSIYLHLFTIYLQVMVGTFFYVNRWQFDVNVVSSNSWQMWTIKQQWILWRLWTPLQ